MVSSVAHFDPRTLTLDERAAEREMRIVALTSEHHPDLRIQRKRIARMQSVYNYIDSIRYENFSPDHLLHVVSIYFNQPIADIKSGDKHRPLVYSRAVVTWILHRYGWGYNEIADILGFNGHAAAVGSCSRVKSNPKLTALALHFCSMIDIPRRTMEVNQ